PCGVHPEVPAKDFVQGTEAVSGGGIPTVGRAEGKSDRRRTFDARPCAHDDSDSAEVRGVASDWVYQGQERDSPGTGLRREEAKFCGQHFWARGYFVSTWAGTRRSYESISGSRSKRTSGWIRWA